MRLSITEPAFEQIKKFDGPLFYDLRDERMGDFAAALAVMDWIEWRLSAIESLGDKPIYRNLIAVVPPDAPLDISAVRQVKILERLAPLDGLDVHTKDLPIPSLWSLNQRALIEGRHPKLSVTGRDLQEIVFVPLAEVEYNQRRNMDLGWVRETVNALRNAGHFVNIFYDKPHRDLQDAIHLPLAELIPRIAGAKLFIGGDSGLGHCAAACDVPQIAIYPDWIRFGKHTYSDAQRVADWWEIPFTLASFLPNNPRSAFVELGTNHRWSIAQVVEIASRYGNVDKAG